MTIGESLKLEGRFGSVFGRLGEPSRAPGDEFESEVREKRLQFARRCSSWTELPAPPVPRRRVYVDAETDEVFTPYRGIVFQTASASAVADYAPLHYFVTPEGELVFFEKQTKTWSELVERRERRRATRARA